MSVALTARTPYAQTTQREIIFSEDFSDISLPAWSQARPAEVELTATQGPGGIPALTMEARKAVSSNLSVRLPVERIAGKAVLLEVWRKADDVKTGAEHYYNAKSMLSWKAEGEAKPHYAGTTYSDFSGTFDWEQHRFVVNMPEDLQ